MSVLLGVVAITARIFFQVSGAAGEVLSGVHRQVGAFGQVLAQQPVGVLVGAALPGLVRVAGVDPGCRWAMVKSTYQAAAQVVPRC